MRKKRIPSDTHRKVWKSVNGEIPVDAFGRSYDIHHLDGNYDNNDISNLKAMSIQEHYDIHYQNGDYGACYMIGLRMDLGHTELSLLSSGTQKKRIADGTHHFLDSELQKEIQRRRIENGTHNFLDSEYQRNNANNRVADGTHPWLDSTKATERNLKRVAEGTHHFLGDKNPGKIAMENKTSKFLDKKWQKEKAMSSVKNGTHNSQVSWVCEHCGKNGKGVGAYSRFHGNKCKSITGI